MKRFLIVDDDPACRRLLEFYLRPYGRCETAVDGDKAVEAFRAALLAQDPFDLICLDIMMPEADGHQVLARIREIESGRGIPGNDGVKIVMTTALTDSRHCVRAFMEGCESYVTKPIRQTKLLEEVRRQLGSLKRVEPQQVPQSGPAGQNYRFLIVDDDGVCRQLLADMLSPFGQCDLAYDGQEAAEAVRLALEDGTAYDLICLDIMMPGTSGHQALECIRQIEAKHDRAGSDGAKVIMTTALRDAKHCVQSFREGCECYLTKPIHEDELLEKLRQLDLLPAGEPRQPVS